MPPSASASQPVVSSSGQLPAARQGERLLATGKSFPALILTDPRRAGKTTLLRRLFPKSSYYLLEDQDLVARVRSDPRTFLDEIDGPAILDETQNTPEVLDYIRTRIDRHPRKKGQWLLTGSQEDSGGTVDEGNHRVYGGKSRRIQPVALLPVGKPQGFASQGGGLRFWHGLPPPVSGFPPTSSPIWNVMCGPSAPSVILRPFGAFLRCSPAGAATFSTVPIWQRHWVFRYRRFPSG